MDKIKRTKKGYGDFGSLSKNYSKARKGFPKESIDYILSKLGAQQLCILDIGCGTGIATEQLQKRRAIVTGTDIDPAMIEKAKANNRYRITYIVAPAEKQPFEDNIFHAVTAFSAFHWFTHKEALHEIKRVLKPGGMFFAINKNEAGDFKKQNKAILKRFITEEMPDAKKEYNPKQILKENGFEKNEEALFPISEFFTPNDALEYIQSMSIWNLVPNKKQGEALAALREHFEKRAQNGEIERKLHVVVVSGKTA